jgi:predicted SAM-dependent methyltransferase
MKQPLPYLNIGCGHRYHPDWVNIDMIAQGEGVIEHDLSGGLPFKNDRFEVVYHSHVLEHIPREAVRGFFLDCHRVLKKDGILRMAFPDLEFAARSYLDQLEKAAESNDSVQFAKYQWMQVELLDQMVRNQSGGAMKTFLHEVQDEQVRKFVISRCGLEVEQMMDAAAQPPKSLQQKIAKFKALSAKAKFNFLWNALSNFFIGKIWLWGDARKAWQIGNFRMSGEVHQWMYDRVSIRQMLKEAGFTDIIIQTAHESQIPNWTSYNLDTENGQTYKPESLFVEAKKTAQRWESR